MSAIPYKGYLIEPYETHDGKCCARVPASMVRSSGRIPMTASFPFIDHAGTSQQGRCNQGRQRLGRHLFKSPFVLLIFWAPAAGCLSYARTIRIKARPTLKPSSTARRTVARPSSLTWAMRSWRTRTALPSAAWLHRRTARPNAALRRSCSRNTPKAQSASPSARIKPTTPAIT